jgi:2-polyprenyl-6-methoxyphenol hydroxylase-like FAD-dependent oxidoreductase
MRVAIAGTGMIGLTAGIALKTLGAQVALLEQAPELRAAGASIGGQVKWMFNQFESAEPTVSKKEEALKRAANVKDNGWGEPLIDLIEATPEESILHNQIMFVRQLPRWTSERVALIGDAAHGVSPHISVGGKLGIEDVRVLARLIERKPTLQAVLAEYEANRIPHYGKIHELADAVEHTVDAQDYAHHQARFAHWMLNGGAAESRVKTA